MIIGLHGFFESSNRWQGCTIALHWLCRCPTYKLDHLDGLSLCFIPHYNDSHAHFINSGLLFEMVEGPHIVLEKVDEGLDSHRAELGGPVQNCISNICQAGERAYPGVYPVHEIQVLAHFEHVGVLEFVPHCSGLILSIIVVVNIRLCRGFRLHSLRLCRWRGRWRYRWFPSPPRHCLHSLLSLPRIPLSFLPASMLPVSGSLFNGLSTFRLAWNLFHCCFVWVLNLGIDRSECWGPSFTLFIHLFN